MSNSIVMRPQHGPHNGIANNEPCGTHEMTGINKNTSDIPELLTRTSWIDASTGYNAIKKVSFIFNFKSVM